MVVGAQAGSEGKGGVTAKLHQWYHYAAAVRIGGPNAGHTVVGRDGKKYALRQLPVASVVDPECTLVIAAGSEIDTEVLFDEIYTLERDGYSVSPRLLIDSEATLITDADKQAESAIKTGTTGKGIGGARAARALRKAKLARDDRALLAPYITDTQAWLRDRYWDGADIMIEGTQGHHLGSHAGYYPYCTSGDCRAVDFLAGCGLPPITPLIFLVARTYPIRIAGNSGPLPHETTWEKVGVPPEYTTVTRKMRRVGGWSSGWVRDAVRANQTLEENVRLVVTFYDYWHPELANKVELPDDGIGREVLKEVRLIQDATGARVALIGTGPDTHIPLEMP